MLTIFTTAKPFVGHSGIIQRNALKSWTLLDPSVEVILFGDEQGAAEISQEMGLRHEPFVKRNEAGLKRIDYYFDRAQEIATHDILCYANCDIIFTDDFRSAVKKVQASCSKFLMVGRRWDIDISQSIDFSNTGWSQEVLRCAIAANRQCDEKWIDYFVFTKGLFYQRIPAFVVGRVIWDNWLVWSADNLRANVIDASNAVRAVHQCHDYSYHPAGKEGVWLDQYSQRNLELAGGWEHVRFIGHASWVLQSNGTLKRRRHYKAWFTYRVWLPTWHFVLNLTRPLRRKLGLRLKNAP